MAELAAASGHRRGSTRAREPSSAPDEGVAVLLLNKKPRDSGIWRAWNIGISEVGLSRMENDNCKAFPRVAVSCGQVGAREKEKEGVAVTARKVGCGYDRAHAL